MIVLLTAVTCIAVALFAHNCVLADQNTHLREQLNRSRAALIRARAPKAGRRATRVSVLDSGFDRPRAPRGGAQ